MNKKLAIILIILLTIGLGIFAAAAIIKQRESPQQASIQRPQATGEPTIPFIPQGDAALIFTPNSFTVGINEEIRAEIELNNLTAVPVAVDILLNYNSNILEFVDIQNVHPDYLNPRKLQENDQLITAFAQKLGVTTTLETERTIKLGTIVFKTKQRGTTTITPLLSGSKKTTLLIFKGSMNNQLRENNSIMVTVQ